jgi:hypothetical protein
MVGTSRERRIAAADRGPLTLQLDGEKATSRHFSPFGTEAGEPDARLSPWRWHLDEMYVKLNGEMVYLW